MCQCCEVTLTLIYLIHINTVTSLQKKKILENHIIDTLINEYRARNRNCPPFTTVEGDSSGSAPCTKIKMQQSKLCKKLLKFRTGF